jgi:hypothetical protein
LSLGLQLLAQLSRPIRSESDFLNQTVQWLRHNCAELSPEISLDESSTKVYCKVHPAAEEFELEVVDSEHVVVSATTTTVGPGYHMYLTSLLKKWAAEIGALWQEADDSSDEYGDETGYFFSMDQSQLEDEMLIWLKGLAGLFFDGTFGSVPSGVALCLPIATQFESEQPAMTATGPRSWDWLRNTAQDPRSGRDFFPWWSPSLDSDYFLRRALTLMWTEVRWRPPVNQREQEVLEDVCRSLSSAQDLNPDQPYPWSEWDELLELLNSASPMRELVHERAGSTSKIGYRRRDVIVSLAGGWSIKIPGSFADFQNDEGDLYALDPPREVWFTAFHFPGSSPQQAFGLNKKSLQVSDSQHVIDDDEFFATATITPKVREDGEEYFVLNAVNLCPAGKSVCTVVFPHSEDTSWALETWRSIRPPKVER